MFRKVRDEQKTIVFLREVSATKITHILLSLYSIEFLANKYINNDEDDKELIARYNEAITGWGSEDHELVCRLINSGVRKRTIKFAGIVFHLHRELHGTDNLNNNRSILNETKVRKLTWCDKGIIQN